MTPIGTFTGLLDRYGNKKVKPSGRGRTVIVRDPYGLHIDAGEEVKYEVTGHGDYVDFGVVSQPTPSEQLRQELIKRGNSPGLVDRLFSTATGYARTRWKDFLELGYQKDISGTIKVYAQCGENRRTLFVSEPNPHIVFQGDYQFEIPGRLAGASLYEAIAKNGIPIQGLIGALTPFPYEGIGKTDIFGDHIGGKGKGILKLAESAGMLEYLTPNTLLVGADFDDYGQLAERADKLRFPVAVRSSSSIEGEKGVSGSGLFESVFIGDIRELPEAMERVKGSVHSPAVATYTIKHGLKKDDIRMGVAIQEVVGCDYLGSRPAFDSYPKTPFVSGVVKSRMEYESDKAQVFAAFGLGTRIMANREAASSRKVPLYSRYSVLDLEKFENRVPQNSMDVIDEAGKIHEVDVPRRFLDLNPLDFVPIKSLLFAARYFEEITGNPVIMEYVLTHFNDYRPVLTLVQLENTERKCLPDTTLGRPIDDDIIATSRNTMGHGKRQVGHIIYLPEFSNMDSGSLVDMHEKLGDLNARLPPGEYCLIYRGKIGSRANSAGRQLVDYSTIYNAGVLVEGVRPEEATNCSHLGRVLDEQEVLYLSDPRDNLERLMKMFPDRQAFSFGGRQLHVFDTEGSVLAQVDSTVRPAGYGLVYKLKA